LTSGEICFLEANLNPLGRIRIPPTFKSAALPSALIWRRVISYGTFISTSNTELGSTPCGASISIAFWFK
jgi:hypothetical protein